MIRYPWIDKVSNQTFYLEEFDESIVDDPARRNMEGVKNSEYSAEKDCLHETVRRSLGPFPRTISGYWDVTMPTWYPYRETYDTGYDTNRHWWFAAVNTALSPTQVAKLTLPSGMPQLSNVPTEVTNRAIASLLPKVNDGLSLINFILELKDLRRMFDFQALDRLLLRVKPLNRDRLKVQLNRRRLERRVGDIKEASDDFLNISFGWAPFIGDLLAMIKALSGLDNRLRYLESHNRRVLVRHYESKLDVDFTPKRDMLIWTGKLGTSRQAYYDPDPDYWVYGNSRWVYQPRYHATLKHYYVLPNVSALRRKLRGYLDAFGIRPDLSIMWNAIPFSFVVDWFVNVGGFLRSFTPNDLGMEVVILDFSHSVKYHHLASMTGKAPRANSQILDECEFWSEERRFYERKKWIPYLHSISASDPTYMQYSLGGALVLSNTRKTKRRRIR